jgi:adenylate cyclase
MNVGKESGKPPGERSPTLKGRAFSLFRSSSPPTLGWVLVREGIITEEQLQTALSIQKRDPQRLGQIIVEQGFASEAAILQAITKEYGVSVESLSEDFGDRIREGPRSLFKRVTGRRIPIRAKLSIAITFIIWLTILILSFTILARQKNSLYQQTLRTGKVSLNYFVNNAAVPLLEDDIVRLNTQIKEAGSVEGLLYAVILDRQRTVKAHTDSSLIGTELPALPGREKATREDDTSYFKTRLPSGIHALVLSRPVIFSGVELGRALVAVSLDFIDEQIWREGLNVIILSFFIVLLGIAIAVQIGVGFARPISDLVTATREIGKGNFEHRIKNIRKDEFGDLAAAFNYMSLELWRKLKMQKSFGSYLSPEILEMVMAQPEEEWLKGQRMSVTVLFTDIRGFTSYSENNEPEVVVENVNRYFEIATRHIQDQGGYIDKFIGDAVLGVFGAPVARPDHAARAVRAAVAMEREFHSRAGRNDPLLEKVGIGINTGEAVAGDLGSEAKKEYSVIGDCVNLASRLNSLAEGGQIIISGATHEAAKHILNVKSLGPVMVKGKAEEIETFEVLDLLEEDSAAGTAPAGG